MIRFLFTLVVFVVGALKGYSQGMPLLHSAGTFFEDSPAGYKGWSNSNGNDFTKASYKYYDGVTYITLKPNNDVNVTFLCTTEVKQGALNVVFENGKDTLKTLNFYKDGAEEVVITLKKGEEYKIKFTGKASKGSYKCSWRTDQL